MKPSIDQAIAAIGAALLCAATPHAIAQEASHPQTWSAREEQSPWINDPAFHEFYEATVDAFANGPDHIDRAAFERRSREIFTAFAVAHDMPVEAVLNHLAAIPGQMIENARREPEILASYDSFAEALFGPQSFPANAPRVGGE